MLLSGKQTQWLDYLPSRVLAMTATSSFAAVAMQDGSVNVYTTTGRRSVSLNALVDEVFFLVFLFLTIYVFQVDAHFESWITMSCNRFKQEFAYGSDILRAAVLLVSQFSLRC